MSTEPKMQTIEWTLETNMVDGVWEGEIEIEADATDEQIDEVVRETILGSYVSWGWSKKGADHA